MANFKNQVFRDDSVEAEFLSNDEGYFVRLREQGGDVMTWKVDYTFGVYPLQQYLLEVGNGRLQALNIAWDTRPATLGGQRWFRLDAQSHPVKGDALHWQGVYQNWNSQCAGCHSTRLRKNYDPTTKQYQTTWAEINVACEACHGSSELHLTKVQVDQQPQAGDFSATIDAVSVWLKKSDTDTAVNQSRKTTGQVKVCAECHSLRTRLLNRQEPSLDAQAGTLAHQYTDQYSLERLESPLYFPDGQIKEEVFVYGSFLQSKMHGKGVVCSDCHEPHSLKLKRTGNALCTQCHKAEVFDSAQHHHHTAAGSACVDCHMPKRTFMVIDDRRDHSFRVPRPDLSVRYNSPDVCTNCHQDNNPAWAAGQIKQWRNGEIPGRHWSEWRDENDLELLLSFVADPSQPALVRSTLLEYRGQQVAVQLPLKLLTLMSDNASLVRESAYLVARHIDPDMWIGMMPGYWQGLTDPVRAVRLMAYETAVLSGLSPTAGEQKQSLNRVAEEYQAFLNVQSDKPSGLAMKARYLRAKDKISDAVDALTEALLLDQQYLPALLELADLYRQSGRIAEAAETLKIAVNQHPDSAVSHHLLGLAQLKVKQYAAALDALAVATELQPDNLLYGYRYAVALARLGKTLQATAVVERLLPLAPQDKNLLLLLQQLEADK